MKTLEIFSLQDRDVWVFGGAGHLGRACVKSLLDSGAGVLCIDKDDLSYKLEPEIYSKKFSPYNLNVFDEREVLAFVQEKIKIHGVPHGIVILTTGTTAKSFDELTVSDFDVVNHNGLSSTFFLARTVGEYMVKENGGSIVLFSSMYGHVSPYPTLYKSPMNINPIEYGVGKAGIAQMSKYIAVHWAKSGIRCNCISPGPFPNQVVQKKFPDFINRLEERVPMGRIGQPDEIGGIVVFLLSGASSYITGQNLFVDGGWTSW